MNVDLSFLWFPPPFLLCLTHKYFSVQLIPYLSLATSCTATGRDKVMMKQKGVQ